MVQQELVSRGSFASNYKLLFIQYVVHRTLNNQSWVIEEVPS